MKFVSSLIAMAALSAGVTSCAQSVTKNAPVAKSGPIGARFEGLGKVMLHAGQPCSPQIMFDFRAARSTSTVWLAAAVREERTLTDAANHNRRVHISGAWRRGKEKGCSYVNVTQVEPQKSIW